MAGPIDSISVNLFMPSLLHLASVKTAIPLFKCFDTETLKEALSEIQLGYPAAFHKVNRENRQDNCNRAKESILFIPEHLRSKVKIALNGLHQSTLAWQCHHSGNLDIAYAKRIINWKSDGTINKIETAQQLVLDVNIDIKVRFDIACLYCFEKSIQTLWAKMEESERTKCLQTSDKCMSRFWAEWLCDGCRVPWMQAIGENLNPSDTGVHCSPRFSSFFPYLRPEDREKFFFPLSFTTLDDMRLCLSIVTKEEKELILKQIAFKFLLYHLQWPMQSMFLDAAEKVEGYICDCEFIHLLYCILEYEQNYTDFDYGKLFDDFWIRIPNHCKESAKQWKPLSEKIEFHTNEKSRKRKVADENKQFQTQKRTN